MTDQVLGHYRVLEKIGSGGMGEVYRARDDRLGRDVALKVLKSTLAHDQDRLHRFEQEARAAAALSHPNIVAVYDIGVHEGAPYIVTELLEGETLRQRLSSGPIPIRQAADYGAQIAQALAVAHEKHIVHRDLKPENLFLTKDGRIKILDFGIAKLTSLEVSDDSSITDLTTQTKSGAVLGTVAYMSPEQLRGKPVDHRSDIFSLGAILYEMLTGQRAFAGETEVDTMTAVLKEEPSDVPLVRQGIPESFEQIIRHCLEKEPEQRFQSARDLAFALSAVPGSTTARQAAFRLSSGKIRGRLIWLAVAVVIAIAGTYLGIHLRPVPPTYRRITFERGTIYSARFSPTDKSILYSASWNGRPADVYSTIGDSLMARSLGYTATQLLAVSPTNELAVALNIGNAPGRGAAAMLASAPSVGGAPREVLDNVSASDWSAQGQLAAVHYAQGHARLEFPIGKVLYQTVGWISDLRFSPQGDKIAFLDHPLPDDDRGSVRVIGLDGHAIASSEEWQSEQGLAWSAKGKEVWFSATQRGNNRAIWALSLSGAQREVLAAPGSLTLRDVSPDGRVIVTVDSERVAMEWTGADNNQVQDLSWFDWTIPKDVSNDGRKVLFEESSEPAGPHYSVGIRKTDGSPPIQLGEGSGGGLSPDGKWAASVYPGTPQRLILYPTGPGQPIQIPVPQLESINGGFARFLPDGKRVLFTGNEPGHRRRTFLIDVTGNNLRALTPEGSVASMPSPDGKFVVGADATPALKLYPAEGGEPRLVPAGPAGYFAAQWSAHGRSLYVYRPGEVPVSIYRLEVATGRMQLVRTIVPSDRAGVVAVAPVITNPDGSGFAYGYDQILSTLYVITGLH